MRSLHDDPVSVDGGIAPMLRPAPSGLPKFLLGQDPIKGPQGRTECENAVSLSG